MQEKFKKEISMRFEMQKRIVDQDILIKQKESMISQIEKNLQKDLDIINGLKFENQQLVVKMQRISDAKRERNSSNKK